MFILQAADRAASLGLSPEDRGDASFGCNQSLPASRLTSLQLARRMDSPSQGSRKLQIVCKRGFFRAKFSAK